jgi:hypothetical protein
MEEGKREIEKSDVSMKRATLSPEDDDVEEKKREKRPEKKENHFRSYQHLFHMNSYKWLADASRLSPCS